MLDKYYKPELVEQGIYKDWEDKGYKNEDMAQDVKVIMPPLDLMSKT